MYTKLLLIVFFYTLSLTAQWELISSPVINDNLFKAYRFSDDEWLISTDSEDFIKTDDKFKNFRKINSGTSGSANEFVFFNDTGYVLKYNPSFLERCSLIKTTDRGESWSVVRIDPLTSISFINKDTGWVTSEDSIFLTKDGGLTWETVFDEPVQQVLFLDFWKGFSIIYGYPYISNDGGASWQWVNLPGDEFYAIYFQNKLRGMLIAELDDDLIIYLTTDGGVTFTSSSPPDFIPHTLSLRDSSIFLVADGGYTSRSDDFGATWYSFSLPAFSYHYFDNNMCIAFGYYGQIIKTLDGGKSWRHIGDKPGGDKVQFVDSLNGFTSPWFVTTDGGENWFYKDLLVPDVNYQDFHFFTPDTGVAIFNDFLMGTNDGGLTWDTVFYNPENPVTEFFFLDSKNGWIIVFQGLVSGVRRTTDGGKTWSDFIDISLDEFSTRKILFLTANTGFIYNDDETYGIEGYKTTDGGLTWYDNDFAKVEYMSFIDTTTGFGSGITGQNNYSLIKTTDAGNSFNLVSSGSFFYANIFFINDLIGWRINHNSTAFQITYDGGLTWETEYILPFLTSRIGWNRNNKILFAGTNKLVLYRRSFLSVDVQEKDDPSEYSLAQNYPNPFNPVTKIKYSVAGESYIRIKIFDILGSEIETLVDAEKPAGKYEITWSANGLPGGVYFYQLSAGGIIETKKMILIK